MLRLPISVPSAGGGAAPVRAGEAALRCARAARGSLQSCSCLEGGKFFRKTRRGGRIVLIDVGISRVYGRNQAALKIAGGAGGGSGGGGGNLTALYRHGRVALDEA